MRTTAERHARRARTSPYVLFALVAAGGVAALSALAAARLGIRWLYAYLAAVNVCTFLCYGYDKLSARRGWLRVPELVLHVLAVLGGTPAAWAGRKAFRHKTMKSSFRRVFWLVVAVQAVGMALWLWCF